jgi:uncharacterized protein (DUF983 family)
VEEDMRAGRRSIINTLFRCIRLSCPACGQSSIVQGPFQIKHHCSSCDALFKREDGFFVGAILANVVITEFVILAFYLLWLLTIIGREQLMLTVLFSVAILFPVAFYHHSWSFWLGFDYLIESLPKYVERGSE